MLRNMVGLFLSMLVSNISARQIDEHGAGRAWRSLAISERRIYDARNIDSLAETEW
jgi:hypothetical protein